MTGFNVRKDAAVRGYPPLPPHRPVGATPPVKWLPPAKAGAAFCADGHPPVAPQDAAGTPEPPPERAHAADVQSAELPAETALPPTPPPPGASPAIAPAPGPGHSFPAEIEAPPVAVA